VNRRTNHIVQLSQVNLVSVLLLFPFSICSNAQYVTSKFAGTYSFGKDIEKERVGTVIVYPETDSTILYYIDLNRGAPSYNMGSLYSRVKLKNGEAEFQTQVSPNKCCKWVFKFSNEALTIATVENCVDCGFGYHVYVDGKYFRISKKIPEHFVNGEGRKIFFKETTPEKYLK